MTEKRFFQNYKYKPENDRTEVFDVTTGPLTGEQRAKLKRDSFSTALKDRNSARLLRIVIPTMEDFGSYLRMADLPKMLMHHRFIGIDAMQAEPETVEQNDRLKTRLERELEELRSKVYAKLDLPDNVPAIEKRQDLFGREWCLAIGGYNIEEGDCVLKLRFIYQPAEVGAMLTRHIAPSGLVGNKLVQPFSPVIIQNAIHSKQADVLSFWTPKFSIASTNLVLKNTVKPSDELEVGQSFTLKRSYTPRDNYFLKEDDNYDEKTDHFKHHFTAKVDEVLS